MDCQKCGKECKDNFEPFCKECFKEIDLEISKSEQRTKTEASDAEKIAKIRELLSGGYNSAWTINEIKKVLGMEEN